MSEVLGTIKFVDYDTVITKKESSTQVWTRFGGDPNHFIVHQGVVYKLAKSS